MEIKGSPRHFWVSADRTSLMFLALAGPDAEPPL